MAKISVSGGWTGGASTAGSLPPGGQTGDMLTKSSSADGDVQWEAMPSMPPGSMEGMWQWQATPVQITIVGSKRVGVDTDDPRLATTLYISTFDVDSVDRTAMLEGINNGDQITFTVVGEPTSWHRYQATGSSALYENYFVIPVKTVIGSAAGTEPATGTEVVVVVDHSIPPPEPTSYRHVQVTAATVWTINHNLGFNPNVSVVDSAKSEIWPGDVVYVSPVQMQLTFSAAVGGEAYLS